MSKKPIKIIILVLVIGTIITILTYKKTPLDSNEGSLIEVKDTETSNQRPKQDASNTTKETVNLIKNVSMQDKAWGVFEKYIDYAHDHDIEGVKSLSYKFTGTCSKASESNEMQKKCFDILDSVYKMGTNMRKASFPNTSSDGKQIILSSNIKSTDIGDTVELSKNLIYFIITNDGSVKLLGIEDGRTTSVKKNGLSQFEIEKSIQDKKIDTDSDGLEDVLETCALNYISQTCIKTDPNKKDTDDDGFWDSVEPLL